MKRFQKKKEKLFARLNPLVNFIRSKDRVSIYEAADELGIADVNYFKRTYVPRLLERYEDIAFDGKYLYSTMSKSRGVREMEVEIREDDS